MLRFYRHLRRLLARFFGRRSHHEALAAVEYEAVFLIVYEGREGYARARERPSTGVRGSEKELWFRSEVAGEADRCIGARIRKLPERPR
jgi:hypothetical protein